MSESDDEGFRFNRSLMTMIAITAIITASGKCAFSKYETTRIADPNIRQAYFNIPSR
jgi:hypothetical protein